MRTRDIYAARISALATVALILIIAACGEPEDADGPRLYSEQEVAASMIEAYGCWTDQEPDGVDAEFALLGDGITDTNDVRISTPREFKLAIEQEVFGIDHGLVVYAFCPHFHQTQEN